MERSQSQSQVEEMLLGFPIFPGARSGPWRHPELASWGFLSLLECKIMTLHYTAVLWTAIIEY